ncbi:MAG: DUF5916 domain-containing protein [Candidatus Krumholzibacteriia bacterium]
MRSRIWPIVCIPILAALIVAVAEAGWAGNAASDDQAEIQALRLSEEESQLFRLDGALHEPFWQEAGPASGFRQREPDEGEPASESTEVRVAYDDHNLYVGVIACDREPDRIVARVLQRDRIMRPGGFTQKPAFAGDDAIALLLDPFHDHRNGVVFATNPSGAEFDALLTDEGREFNVDWRGVWSVAATRTSRGWSAEFAIPWRTLRYPARSSGGTWGFNVFRVIRRKNEEVLWRSWSRDGGGFHRVSRAGHLVGLTRLPRPGMNIEVKPYFLAGTQRELDDDHELSTDGELDVGLDLKTELRPGLVMDVTLNTDFAQVEVDDERVNLTRFDLFFPEKRDFFLENAGIFEFGQSGNRFEPPPFLLFFSRTIGISDDDEVPILGGTRITGRVGGQTIGFLDVVMDAVGETIQRENFAVARVKRDVGETNYVGWMLTDRRGGDAANTTTGVDASLWLNSSLNLQTFAAWTFTEGEGGDDHAYKISLDYTANRYGFFGQHLTVGPDAQADVGFVTRTDIRRSEAYFRYTPRPKILGLRKINIFNGGSYISGLDGREQDWNLGPFVGLQWDSGESMSLFYNRGKTVLDEGFSLADSVPIDEGRYSTNAMGVFANTSSSRAVSLSFNGIFADFFGGDMVSYGGQLGMSPNPKVSLALGYDRNEVDVGSGFTVDIASVRASYSFSTRLTTNVLLQYNSFAEAFSINARLNFIHRPGSDIFLVFTEERGDDGDLWDLSDRVVILKLTYLSRF